jgi:hypothetical protein
VLGAAFRGPFGSQNKIILEGMFSHLLLGTQMHLQEVHRRERLHVNVGTMARDPSFIIAGGQRIVPRESEAVNSGSTNPVPYTMWEYRLPRPDGCMEAALWKLAVCWITIRTPVTMKMLELSAAPIRRTSASIGSDQFFIGTEG